MTTSSKRRDISQRFHPLCESGGGYVARVSYDLTVYGPEALEGVELREFISSQEALAVDAFDDERGWIAVARGAKRRYCFTVDGPVRVEPEDVPEDVTAAVLGVTHMYRLTVEGSAETDVPHAIRFARRLAESLGGAVVDQQADEVWARGASRTATRPVHDERVNVIRLDWYSRRVNVPDNFGERYTSLCRQLLPEALPRRFGEFEPFQGKLADVGHEGFARAWRGSMSMVFFSATAPCIAGWLSAGAEERFPHPVWDMSLTLHYEPLTDMRWADAARRFFVAIAHHSRAFFASAEITRGSIWNGRSLWSDQDTEWPISPARREGWMGLPPYPVWWAWYGAPYRDLIRSPLSHGRVEVHDQGVLHELAEFPLDRDQLTKLVTVRRGLRRRAGWVPPELLAQVQPSDGRVQPVPLRSAEHIPGDLL